MHITVFSLPMIPDLHSLEMDVVLVTEFVVYSLLELDIEIERGFAFVEEMTHLIVENGYVHVHM